MKRKYYFIPTLLVTVAIIYLSLGRISTPRALPRIPHLDKVVHFVIYCGFAFVVGFDTLRYRKWAHRALSRKLFFAWLVALLMGSLMEVLQALFTTYRSGHWGDMIANTLGAIVGILLVRYIVYPLVTARQRGHK